MAQDYPVPIPVDAFGGFGGGFGGYGGGFGGYGGGFGGGLPYGGLGLALNSVQNQNQMGLFGGAGGQSTLGGGIAHSTLNTVSNINVHFYVIDIVYSFYNLQKPNMKI